MNQCFAQIPQIKDANSVNDHKIIGLFVLWDEMYMKSCEEPTESSLAEFKKLHLPDSIIAHSDNYCHDKPEFSNVAIEMAESKNDECIPDEIYW
ncbi:3399_t:CDS:2 [Entrophospora sp. SA101]|nr:3399_t:CDS:2 [Entrophospora sp. SA101]